MIGWREAEAKLPLRIVRAAYGCLIPACNTARHGAVWGGLVLRRKGRRGRGSGLEAGGKEGRPVAQHKNQVAGSAQSHQGAAGAQERQASTHVGI